MKPLLQIVLSALLFSVPLRAQGTPVTPQSPPPPGNTPQGQQSNAASATKDTSAISGDQISKPAGAKGSTLIGCLSGPDQDGKFELRSMQHRTGVEVLGPETLKDDNGAKVKLTGSWVPGEQPSSEGKASRRFQVTDVEVLAAKCQAPAEQTPVSKQKPPSKAGATAQPQ